MIAREGKTLRSLTQSSYSKVSSRMGEWVYEAQSSQRDCQKLMAAEGMCVPNFSV